METHRKANKYFLRIMYAIYRKYVMYLEKM